VAGDVIREYLLALGWKIDDESWRRYSSAVAMTAKETAAVGSVAIETATAIEVMVARVARQYESLYYVSQRAGLSVSFLQASQFGFRQIGLSAEEAIGSIESVAATMRTQPWLAALFGGARTPQDIADKLGASGLPYFVQARLAGMAGIDEKTFFQLQRYSAWNHQAMDDFTRRQREAGVDADALAKRLAGGPGSLIWSLNRLESEFDVMGERIAMDWVNPVQRGVDALDRAVQWLNRADAATRGWVGTLETLAVTVTGGFLGEKILRKILGAAGFDVGSATLTGGALGLGGRALGLGLRGGWIGAVVAALQLEKENDPETKRRLRESLGPTLYSLGLTTTPDLVGAAGGSVGDRLQQTIAFFQRAGFSPEAARGIASALYFESGKTLDPHAVNPLGGGQGARGVPQLRGARLEQFRKMFGKDPTQATLDENLQFVLWEMTQGTDRGALAAGAALRRRGVTAGGAAEDFLNLYERPGAGGAAEVMDARRFAEGLSRSAARTSTQSVTLNQKTSIVISGAGAKDAAFSVKQAQSEINNDLVRNLSARVR
jgi:Phage tail lysozyme